MGKIRGEARNYDPYSRFGHIMLYEIDSFGYVPGYVSREWCVMSEQDILADNRMTKRLQAARYQVWKRHNMAELHTAYENLNPVHRGSFEKFCRKIFDETS